MPRNRRIVAFLSVFVLAGFLAGCGDTWDGLKEDTGRNLKKTGEALDKAGESVTK